MPLCCGLWACGLWGEVIKKVAKRLAEHNFRHVHSRKQVVGGGGCWSDPDEKAAPCVFSCQPQLRRWCTF